LVIIALQASSGLVLNAKKMYIKATSHCLIRYQSIVGEFCTIKSEDKFTQSPLLRIVVHFHNLCYNACSITSIRKKSSMMIYDTTV
ncbi:MAG: hypothetical protein LBS02_02495, partial [Hungatella sp.]|nr:hypothetical protein [Hungatella sp.]